MSDSAPTTMLNDDTLDTKIEGLPPGVRYVATGAIFRQLTSDSGMRHRPQLLIVKRAKDETAFPDHWELPGGKVDPGETIREGLVREIFEETGLAVQAVVGKLSEISWTSPKDQAWLQNAYVVSVQQPAEVHLDPVEHGEWCWSVEEELAGLLRLPTQAKLMAEAFKFERQRLASETGRL